MKRNLILFTGIALMIGGETVLAQQKFDSLGAPTPAPQNASPDISAPNVPSPGADINTKNNDIVTDQSGTSYTTGAGGDRMPIPRAETSPNQSNTGVSTPSGLSND
jgi:hypothetical protein